MPRSPYRVRAATLDDLDVLVAHRRHMWSEIGEFDTATLDACDKPYKVWMRRMMRADRLAGFIVERKGDPVASGCVWLQDVQPRPPDNKLLVPYVLSMYTDPGHRGHGLAERIVKETIRWSRTRGYQKVVLHAAPLGRAIYERVGFERTWEMRLSLR